MSRSQQIPDRVHLLAHANPATKDIRRFGFADAGAYLRFIREHTPEPLRVTARRPLLEAVEDELHGGRRDDAARIGDLQAALDDPRTLAIVALNGGAYFSRILPHVDFSALKSRRSPLWALGFSEMTNFVNLVASHRGGRGLYWLCPSFLAWRIKPADAAREAFASFWRRLPELLALPASAVPVSRRAPDTETGSDHFGYSAAIDGQLVSGVCGDGRIRIVGGCLSVLCAMLAGALGRRLRPRGAWLLIEDINEQEYRIDRYLATLKIAGWFDQLAGVIVGAFRLGRRDQIPAVVELLRYHLPRARRVRIIAAQQVGHTWPMTPVEVNRALVMEVRGRAVTIRNPAFERAALREPG